MEGVEISARRKKQKKKNENENKNEKRKTQKKRKKEKREEEKYTVNPNERIGARSIGMENTPPFLSIEGEKDIRGNRK